MELSSVKERTENVRVGNGVLEELHLLTAGERHIANVLGLRPVRQLARKRVQVSSVSMRGRFEHVLFEQFPPAGPVPVIRPLHPAALQLHLRCLQVPTLPHLPWNIPLQLLLIHSLPFVLKRKRNEFKCSISTSKFQNFPNFRNFPISKISKTLIHSFPFYLVELQSKSY